MSASCALVLVPVVGLLSMLRGQGYIYRNTGTLFLPELTANTGVMVVHSGQKGQEWRIAFPLNYKEIGLIFRNSIKFSS